MSSNCQEERLGAQGEPSPRVRFSVVDDADAVRIEGVLESLGFEVYRAEDDELGEPEVLARVVDRMQRRYRLIEIEAALLPGLLRGDDDDALIEALQICRGTLRYRESCLLDKLGVGDREGLLRLLLLGGERSRAPWRTGRSP